jgi:hypothetical protein
MPEHRTLGPTWIGRGISKVASTDVVSALRQKATQRLTSTAKWFVNDLAKKGGITPEAVTDVVRWTVQEVFTPVLVLIGGVAGVWLSIWGWWHF